MANQKKNTVSEEILEGEEIQELPLSEVEANFNWNSRGNVDSNSGKTAEIKASLALNGQEVPAIARPMPGGKRGKQTCSIVCGFTRYQLLSEIAKESGNKNPTIKVVVRSMTEAEALKLNVRENMARETLSDADLVFAVGRLIKLEPAITDTALGQSIGMSQPYAGTLKKIASKIKPTILTDWRENKVTKDPATPDAKARHTATIKQMKELADAMPDRQDEEYAKVCAEVKGGGGSASWKDGVIERAKEQGVLFGRLFKLGAMPKLASDFFPKYLGLLISIPTHAGRAKKADGSEGGKAEVTEAMRQEFYTAARDAYTAACTADFVWPPPPKEPKAKPLKSDDMTPEEYAKKWKAKQDAKAAKAAESQN
jgi:hypothetical protein